MNHIKQRIPLSLIDRIASIIEAEKKQITNIQLLELCGEAGIDVLSTEAHLCHEIAETALNHLVKTKYGERLLSSLNPSASCIGILKPLQKRLPTQSWRSEAQITHRLYSYPYRPVNRWSVLCRPQRRVTWISRIEESTTFWPFLFRWSNRRQRGSHAFHKNILRCCKNTQAFWDHRRNECDADQRLEIASLTTRKKMSSWDDNSRDTNHLIGTL